MKDLEFIISLKVGFSQVLTGGILVLHKLAHEIAKKGYKVTIFTNPEYPHENIRVVEGCSEDNLSFGYNKEKTVIIPSFDWKNNSNIKNVARWALYHIDETSVKNIDDEDEIYNFGFFSIPTNKTIHKLTVFDYKKEVFFNKVEKRRKKYCHILLKNNPENAHEVIKYFNSFDLSDYKTKGCFGYLSEKFNEYEYFLTFDEKTFLTTAAAMCGCKSIILNKNNGCPIKFRKENPIQELGVAYGLSDLDWAEKTIDFVPNHIDFLIKKDNETVDNFIKYWENKLK
jgi:hypothetical protein